MKLVASWEVEGFFYQVWETGTEFACHWVNGNTLETIVRGAGNTPQDAVADSLKNGLRVRPEDV